MTTLPIRLSQPPSCRPLPFPAKKHVIRATLSTRVNPSPTSHTDPRRAGSDPPPKATPVAVTASPKILDDTELEPRGLTDFVDQSRLMIQSSNGDGGPPRWFSPVECTSVAARAVESPPLLLYLPGLDGVGLGLIRHHQRLQRIFDVWCLHIPVMDQTPFEGLIEYVENTIKVEVAHKLDKPIYLVGESLGACIALSVAARNPDVDFVLVLANPGTSFNNSQLQSLSVVLDVIPEPLHNSIPYFLSFIAGNPIRMATSTDKDELSLEETIGALPMSFTQMLPNLPFLAEILPNNSLVWKLKMLKSASLYANSRLHAVKADTLILASGRDQLLPSRKEAERLSKTLSNCRIRHYNNSGHTIFLEGGNDLVGVIKATNFYRRSRVKDYVSDYLLPTPYEFKKAVDGYRWVELAADPVMLSTLINGNIVRSLEGIPSVGPTLFVGYHMLMGFDLGHLISRLFTEKNIHLRGIGHPFMFDRDCEKLMFDSSSFDSIRVMGAVPVSASGLYKLLSKKSHVLLFPGGAREACHKKGEQYKLFWPEQSEFVRMASRFGATIIPFAVVGEDDIAEVVLDIDDYKNIPFYDSLHKVINQEGIRLRSDVSGEVGNQDLYLPGIMPKLPGRLYFLFGKPIETKGRRDELKDKDKAQRLYMHIKSEIENIITYLKESATWLTWHSHFITGLSVEDDRENKRATVVGSGVGKESQEEVQLFLGNAGTSMCPLTAVVTAAGGNASYILDGVPRMSERPIRDLVVGLKQPGADVDCTLGMIAHLSWWMQMVVFQEGRFMPPAYY